MRADAKNFYLATPLDRYECMKMPGNLTPSKFIEENNLTGKKSRVGTYTPKLYVVCVDYHKRAS